MTAEAGSSQGKHWISSCLSQKADTSSPFSAVSSSLMNNFRQGVKYILCILLHTYTLQNVFSWQVFLKLFRLVLLFFILYSFIFNYNNLITIHDDIQKPPVFLPKKGSKYICWVLYTHLRYLVQKMDTENTIARIHDQWGSSEKMETRRTIIFKIRRSKLKFLGYIMRKEGLENLALTRYIKGRIISE